MERITGKVWPMAKRVRAVPQLGEIRPLGTDYEYHNPYGYCRRLKKIDIKPDMRHEGQRIAVLYTGSYREK